MEGSDPSATQLSEFVDFHMPALETNEVRHNLIIAIMASAAGEQSSALLKWTLGGPGRCAFKSPGRAIVLGELARSQCRRLAKEVRDLDFPGVLGPDLTAQWFVERATALGLDFQEPIPQGIHALSKAPVYPGAPGETRLVTGADGPLFANWVTAFLIEASPHDPIPPRNVLEERVNEGRHMLWTVDGRPVSLAGIVRRTRSAAAIGSVYTPPEERGRGYAGSVTAAVVERIYAEGRKVACLYTDLRNPVSNRCYAKIGFKPVCESRFYARRPG